MSREAVLQKYRSAIPVIAPSMLKCDFANLQREIERLESAGAKVLHLDVMDGRFVPNLSYGPVLIRSIRRCTNLPFDAHLMISEPERYLDDFLEAGCDCITFHVEAESDPPRLLRRIRNSGAVAGLALNPGTPVSAIESALADCDLVLVMSVEPGFGGQEFIRSSLGKLRTISRMMDPGTLLSIDGGVGPATIAEAARRGANVFVVGSAIFDTDDYAAAIDEMARTAGSHLVSPSLEK